jgi:hypothetical protein
MLEGRKPRAGHHRRDMEERQWRGWRRPRLGLPRVVGTLAPLLLPQSSTGDGHRHHPMQRSRPGPRIWTRWLAPPQQIVVERPPIPCHLRHHGAAAAARASASGIERGGGGVGLTSGGMRFRRGCRPRMRHGEVSFFFRLLSCLQLSRCLVKVVYYIIRRSVRTAISDSISTSVYCRSS